MSKILITISFHFSFKSNIPNSIILVNVINYDKNPEGQNNLPQQSGGRTGTLDTGTSYIVIGNIVTGISWPWEHRKREHRI